MRLILIGVLLALFSCKTNDEVDISKYPMITTAKELMDFYDLRLDTLGAHEESKIINYFDGSSELEYTYDFIDTENYDPLYYSITIEKERTIKDAIEMYTIGKGAVSLVINTGDEDSEEITEVELPGDQNYYAVRTFDGEPHGLYFTMRKGKVVYTLIMSGLYSEDHSVLYDLIFPEIENLENFSLKP